MMSSCLEFLFHHHRHRASRRHRCEEIFVETAIACGSEIEARLLKVHEIILNFGHFQSQSFSLSYQRSPINIK
jgi:hypothetical protein